MTDYGLSYWGRTPNGVLPIVVLMVGPRWSGKSTMAEALIPQMVGDKSQIVCAGFGNSGIADALGVEFHKLSAVDVKGQEEAAEFFRSIEKREGEFILVLDDSDAAWNQLHSRYMALAEFVRNNRSYGQGALIICHGPGDVQKGVIRNTQLSFWFCQSEANSIDYVRRYMKPDWPNAEMRIRSLPRYQAAVWAPEFPGQSKYVGEAWVRNGDLIICPRDQVEPETPSSNDSDSPPTSPSDGADDAKPASGESPIDFGGASAHVTVKKRTGGATVSKASVPGTGSD